ncbi:MAG: hypothetical protein ACREX9_18970 [Gammaproteobacteria bacterium]
MRLGRPSGVKHDRRVAQYAIADWHIRRCWRSVAAWVDCCKIDPELVNLKPTPNRTLAL